jgi:ABC-type transport system involved in multi-copper enzyme maturation permease subunit
MQKQSSRSLTVGIGSIILIIIIVLVVVLVYRHKNANSVSSMSTAQINSAEQQIKSNWKTFFATTTSLQNRENLLQNGSQFTQEIQGEFAALGAESFSSTINSVNLTNTTAANVVYTVTLGGQTVLKDEKGTAVKVKNTWVVSDTSLCQLLGLGGSKPAVCKTT